MIYKFLRALFSLATRVFFRKIEVEGLERIPAKGPVLLLPNHPNGLVDPFLLLMHLKREVSLTAKSTLTKNPVLALLFRLGKVVPVYRRQDAVEGADLSLNAGSLVEVRRRLEAGGAVCLFPEGISHNEPQLQPLRTGAARVALEYVDVDKDPGGLLIFPIGIEYTRKQSFRSSVLLRVGQPITAADWRRAHLTEDARALMLEIDHRLRELTLNFDTRGASIVVAFAAQLMLTQGSEPGVPAVQVPEPLRQVGMTERLRAAAARLGQEQGAALEVLGSRIRLLMASLKRLGLHPRELFIDMSAGKALLFVGRESAILGVGLPLAAWGALNHFLPYLAVLSVARISAKSRDVWATYAVFAGVLFFPLWWLALAVVLATQLPAWVAATWMLSLVPAGWACLRYRDHGAAVLRRVWAFGLFLMRPGLREQLSGEAKAILVDIERLLK